MSVLVVMMFEWKGESKGLGSRESKGLIYAHEVFQCGVWNDVAVILHDVCPVITGRVGRVFELSLE